MDPEISVHQVTITTRATPAGQAASVPALTNADVERAVESAILAEYVAGVEGVAVDVALVTVNATSQRTDS